jgi:hypothetical protein
MAIRERVPSIIAASMNWPWPEALASITAARMPMAATRLPPAKSATRLSGGSGGAPFGPMPPSAPDSAR